MGGRNALRSKVVVRLHDALPEQVLPHAVHRHAREQGIVRVSHPACEAKPVAVALGQAMQDARCTGLHLLRRAREVALNKPARGARFLAPGHHHRGGRLGSRFFQLGQAILDRLALGILLGQAAQASLDLFDFFIDRGPLKLNLPCRGIDARLVGIVEKSEQPVVLHLRNRIVLVIVALRATKRQPKHHLAGGGDAVVDRIDPELLTIDTALGVDLRIAVKPGGDPLGKRGFREHVTCKLLDHEPVEWQVAIERLDHPVAIRPYRSGGVVAVAVRVGVPGGVQPMASPTFAVMRRLQQTIDRALIGLRFGVSDERRKLVGRRWQPGQIKAHPAQQRGPPCLRRWRQTHLRLLRCHKMIDGILRPVPLSPGQRRQRMPNRRFECPVLIVLRALRDPAMKQLDLLRRQFAVRLRRRHLRVRVCRCDPHEQFTLGHVRHIDRRHAVVELSGPITRIEP